MASEEAAAGAWVVCYSLFDSSAMVLHKSQNRAATLRAEST